MKTYTLQQIQILQSIYLEQFDMYEDFKDIGTYGNEWLLESMYSTKFIIWLQRMEHQKQIELLINKFK